MIYFLVHRRLSISVFITFFTYQSYVPSLCYFVFITPNVYPSVNNPNSSLFPVSFLMSCKSNPSYPFTLGVDMDFEIQCESLFRERFVGQGIATNRFPPLSNLQNVPDKGVEPLFPTICYHYIINWESNPNFTQNGGVLPLNESNIFG